MRMALAGRFLGVPHQEDRRRRHVLLYDSLRFFNPLTQHWFYLRVQ
jgi:hypothetical protein